MSKKASPVAIGVFVLGAIAIVLIGTVFFGASTFFDRTEKFVLYFDGSLQGLKVGAPVSMKGVQVGTVKTISINVYENKQLDVFTEVVIEVNIDNFHQMGDHKVHTGAQQLVHDGLRAQLRLQSLLTGLLYVELDFFPRSAVDLKNLQASKLPELPTIPTEIAQFLKQIENMDLEKVARQAGDIIHGLNAFINSTAMQQVPAQLNDALTSITALADNLNEQLTFSIVPLLDNTNRLVDEFNRELPGLIQQVNTMVAAFNRTAVDAQFLLSDDSPVLYQLTTAADDVGAAASQLKSLAEMLEAHPEWLIRGK